MNKPLNIRHARKQDLAGLMALYSHLHPDDPPCPPAMTEELFKRFKTYPGSAIFLGTIDGDLICTCTLVIIPNLTRAGTPYGLIENVVTHTDHRGKGYGTSVLHSAVEHGFDQGCYKVMLMTGARDPQTLGFYARAGFEPSKAGFQQRRPS